MSAASVDRRLKPAQDTTPIEDISTTKPSPLASAFDHHPQLRRRDARSVPGD